MLGRWLGINGDDAHQFTVQGLEHRSLRVGGVRCDDYTQHVLARVVIEFHQSSGFKITHVRAPKGT